LNIVSGLRIDFKDIPSSRSSAPYPTSAQEDQIIDMEVKRLLASSVIVPCEHEEGEFVSPIFLRGKSDGSHRVILNLK